jgi:hypothetical protein
MCLNPDVPKDRKNSKLHLLRIYEQRYFGSETSIFPITFTKPKLIAVIKSRKNSLTGKDIYLM